MTVCSPTNTAGFGVLARRGAISLTGMEMNQFTMPPETSTAVHSGKLINIIGTLIVVHKEITTFVK